MINIGSCTDFMKLPIYLDAMSTTPVDPGVLEAMLPYFLTHFGNASGRFHAFGRYASDADELAREQVAHIIGAQKEEIVFTSGATESINLALRGVANTYSKKGKHIITCATEHKAVLDTCRHLEQEGFTVTYLPVSTEGHLDLEELKSSITSETILLSFMYANNETGVIFPVAEIGAIAKEKNILFFCDATQAVGKIPVNVLNDGIDLLALSAHKMYGPKGVGALYIRRKNPRVSIKPIITGGGQERGIRSGTLNVPGIVGLGKAAELCRQRMEQERGSISLLRNDLENELVQLGCTVNGDRFHRLPQITNCTFKPLNSTALVASFAPHLAVSSGSACSEESHEPSHVLTAMGLTANEAKRSVRFALTRFTTPDEIEDAKQIIRKIVNDLS